MDNKPELDRIVIEFSSLLERLRYVRPEERSEFSRRMAIVITELEKVYAYFRVFCEDFED